MSQPFQQVNCLSTQYFGPGEEISSPEPGDFILTHGEAWTNKIIRLGQSLRFLGKDRIYTHWDHAALIISKDGDIIEALGAGIKRRNLSNYKPTDYYLVKIKASAEDREQAVTFAKYSLGEEYGWTTILSIGISLITGLKLSFGFDGQQICSGLVARALERTSAIFSRAPSHIAPADLAKYYNVPPPETVIVSH